MEDSTKTIEYFYAAHSAYAWLGSARLMKIAQANGRRLAHRPFDLHRAMQAAGSSAFRERSPAHRRFFFSREIERWAEFRGVRTLGRRPTWHDHSYDTANRMLIAAEAAGRGIDALAHRVLEAHWADDADLADAATLAALARAEGFDPAALLAAADTPAIRERYEANTREAIGRSVFGSPTYFVDGDMFYGQDRLDLVERACARPFADTWRRA
jgi:2-hydroxychromene-2-carboxylate isomerase